MLEASYTGGIQFYAVHSGILVILYTIYIIYIIYTIYIIQYIILDTSLHFIFE